MNAPHLVFAGGGTGGHLFPGLAVANAVRRLLPETRITFMTTDRKLDRELLGPTPFEQVVQPVRPLTMNPLRLPGVWWAWRRSVSAAERFFKNNEIKAVLGLGGYAAAPPVVAASRRGIWTVVLNPDAVPGRANRHIAARADVVALQWDAARAHFSKGVYCQTVGCPIRAAFSQADVAAGRRQFQLDPGRPVLVVTGASQGAQTINRVMMQIWPAFHQTHPEWQLLHLSGPAAEPGVRQAYEQAGVPATVVGFTLNMDAALAAGDVVVARAGASTLAELTALGKPAILLPYPYARDRHQHANARVLAEHGAALVIEDQIEPDLNAPAVRSALEELSSSERRAELAAASHALGRPQAADVVAAWLLS